MSPQAKAGLIFLGGALGSVLRWGLQTLCSGQIAFVTAVINVVGAGLLAWLTATLAGRADTAASRHRAFLGSGLLGGFTTYSAFAVQVVTANPVTAMLLALGSVLAGIAIAHWTMALVERRSAPHRPEAA